MDMMAIRARCISTKYKVLATMVKGKSLNSTNGSEFDYADGACSGFYPVSFDNGKSYDITGLVKELNSTIYGFNQYKQFIHRTYGASRSSFIGMKQSDFMSGTSQGTGDIKFIRIAQGKTSSSTGSIDLIDNARIILSEN